MNTIGNIFRLTTFGESHGKAVGGIIDGCPAGMFLDMDFIQNELNRRRPGQTEITTSRKENDEVEILSGIMDGYTTGAPIGFIVRNSNQNSTDYETLQDIFRPSHADYTYYKKYGIRDYRGGGRSSARETLSRVVAGAIAKLFLQEKGIIIKAYTSQVGTISLDTPYSQLNLDLIEENSIRCPEPHIARKMEELIAEVKLQGDSVGGVISCVCQNIPIGLGEPVFGKLHAALGSAMLNINAAKGFDYGMGFTDIGKRGSEVNDIFYADDNGEIRTKTNHSGGIQGGISNGEDIYFRVAFKPVPSIMQTQKTVDRNGKETILDIKGRHDPCVLPRAVPIVEAMAAITLLDFYLLNKRIK